MNRRLLIFGSGFLVKHIAERFISDGGEVRILYNQHDVPEIDQRMQFKRADIDLVTALLDFRPSYILLANGDSFVTDNFDIERSITKNLMDPLRTLEEIFRNRPQLDFIEKIVSIGSAAEYGRQYESAISETTPTHPTSIYGLTKIFLHETSMYYAWKGLPVVHARQFNAIGPYQRDVFVLSSFCKQIALIENGVNEPVITVGNVQAERDFIDVRDAAKAYCMIFQDGQPGEVYNIANGKAFVIEEILTILLELTSYKKEPIRIHTSVDSGTLRNMLASRLFADNRKLQELGFKPDFTFRKTIEDTLNFWRQNVQ